MELEYLCFLISSGNIEKATNIIKELGEQKNYEAVPCLIKLLIETDNHELRNSIAITLADMGDSAAVEPLIALLENPKTVGYRGSLIYALESLDCSNYIEKIVPFLCDNSFEVRRQAYLLLESMAHNIPGPIKQQCIQLLEESLDQLQDKIELVSESLDLLKEG